ncbi:MAG: hypothetical protein IJF54_02010 [Clostridia bacterium]|nr:hypothetical protein [Clostridia bacterium]
MSKFKRITAIALIFAVVLSFSACRTKDESALVFGDLNASQGDDSRVDIRSAIYILYTMDADREFKTAVQDKIEQASTTSSKEIDVEKEKLDDKDYKTWVKDKAVEYCSEYAYVELEFKKLKLSLTEDEKNECDYYVNMYWDGYGYGPIYEANGVSKTSFAMYWENSFKREALFNYYYGEKGKNSVAAADVKAAIDANYVLANSLSVSFTGSDNKALTDKEKAEAKKKLEAYADRIKKGEKFADLKAEYEAAQKEQQNTTGTGTTAATTTVATTTAGTTATTTTAAPGSAPLDATASIFGGEKTASPSGYFTDIKKLKTGDVKVLEFTDCYMLVVRQDVLKDPYYVKNYDSSARHILKDAEFDKKVSNGAKELDIERNNGAVNFYSPDKLVYTTKAQ